METKFTLNTKEYFVKKFYYKPDRIRQIKFLRKYLDFEKEYLGNELYDKSYNSLQNIKVIEKLSEEVNSNSLNKDEMMKQLTDSLLPTSLSNEFYQKQSEAIQLFLLENEDNAKELCEIHFENAKEINHNPIDDNQFLEYNNFITDLFNYFFFNKNKLSKTLTVA